MTDEVSAALSQLEAAGRPDALGVLKRLSAAFDAGQGVVAGLQAEIDAANAQISALAAELEAAQSAPVSSPTSTAGGV